MRWNFALIPLLLMPAIGFAASEMPDIRVLALFKDKAMFEINGYRCMLVKGKRSPEGVLLVSSSGLQAVVEYDGEQHTLKPEMRIGGSYKAPISKVYRIVRDNSGHFRTPGTINGRPVLFLVDTGATNVAMSETQARSLGINYEFEGQPTMTGTASGVAQAYQVQLQSVAVGNIRKFNVKGLVVKGNSPTQVLLGMSFLNGIEMKNQGNVMVLEMMH
jgi:aspartyl protease family protein